jgi:hypothetical protein
MAEASMTAYVMKPRYDSDTPKICAYSEFWTVAQPPPMTQEGAPPESFSHER